MKMYVRFLKDEEVFGNKRLKIFDEIGTNCIMTDFARLLCGLGVNKDKEIGCWWTGSYSHDFPYDPKIHVIGDYAISKERITSQRIGTRPVFSYSSYYSISSSLSNEALVASDIYSVLYDEYPQTIVDENYSRQLDRMSNNQTLRATGKEYTTISNSIYDNRLNQRKFMEYEYKGDKYIRFNDCYSRWIDGRRINYYWIKVEPIEWFVDKRDNIMMSKYILFSGVPFDTYENFKKFYANRAFIIPNVKKTYLYNFMNNIFIREIVPSNINKKTDNDNKLKIVSDDNKSKMSINNKAKIEEIIDEINKKSSKNPNREKIIMLINDKIREYNNELSELNTKIDNDILVAGSLNELTFKLEINLKIIYDEVIKWYDNNQKYLEIIGYIEKIISLDFNDDKDDFLKDINKIFAICIPFLNEVEGKKIKNEIIRIFNNEKALIEEYLKKNNLANKTAYQNKDEFIMYMRKKIQPVLVSLYSKVCERDIELEINNSLKEIIDGNYLESKMRFISFYLNEINKVIIQLYNVINELPFDKKKEYLDMINGIIGINVDYNCGMDVSLKKLRVVLLSLNKLLAEIDRKNEIKKAINKSYVKFLN
jgi:hypothetical protein